MMHPRRDGRALLDDIMRSSTCAEPRGASRPKARTLLTYAFAADVLQRIADPTVWP